METINYNLPPNELVEGGTLNDELKKIDANIKEVRSSVGYELPDPATAEVGQVVGAVDGAYAFVNPPAPTNPKVYRALLTSQIDDQTGEELNPIVLEAPGNTLVIDSITIIGDGYYQINSNNLFTNLTFVFPANTNTNEENMVLCCKSISTSEIKLQALDGTMTPGTQLLKGTPIEILVYE